MHQWQAAWSMEAAAVAAWQQYRSHEMHMCRIRWLLRIQDYLQAHRFPEVTTRGAYIFLVGNPYKPLICHSYCGRSNIILRNEKFAYINLTSSVADPRSQPCRSQAICFQEKHHFLQGFLKKANISPIYIHRSFRCEHGIKICATVKPTGVCFQTRKRNNNNHPKSRLPREKKIPSPRRSFGTKKIAGV